MTRLVAFTEVSPKKWLFEFHLATSSSPKVSFFTSLCQFKVSIQFSTDCSLPLDLPLVPEGIDNNSQQLFDAPCQLANVNSDSLIADTTGQDHWSFHTLPLLHRTLCLSMAPVPVSNVESTGVDKSKCSRFKVKIIQNWAFCLLVRAKIERTSTATDSLCGKHSNPTWRRLYLRGARLPWRPLPTHPATRSPRIRLIQPLDKPI